MVRDDNRGAGLHLKLLLPFHKSRAGGFMPKPCCPSRRHRADDGRGHGYGELLTRAA